jgi:hypothetical protein
MNNENFEKKAIDSIIKMCNYTTHDCYNTENMAKLILELYYDKLKKCSIENNIIDNNEIKLKDIIMNDLSEYFKKAHKETCDNLQNFFGMDAYLDMPGNVKNNVRQMAEISLKLKKYEYVKNIISEAKNMMEDQIANNYCIVS